jgi:hypothetical protein
LAPVLAHAQTNIDEGKSPAQIFSSDCAACHKSTRGLANGRGSLALKGFLAQHYTSSSDQAAALAAYVLGAGGGEGVPATQSRGAKPEPEHAALPAEESKSSRPTRQTAKREGDASKREGQAPKHEGEGPKREGEAPATAKLQPPAHEENPSAATPNIMEEEPAGSERHPVASRHDGQPAVGAHGRRNEPAAAPSPAAVVASPATSEPEGRPEAVPNPSAAIPANGDSGDNAPVPRDNIPD